MEVVGFVVVAALCLAFLGAVALSQSSIDEAWRWFKDQSLVLQVPVGILFLPWVAGMWIWESFWAALWRLSLVAGLAWATLYAFFPWRAR